MGRVVESYDRKMNVGDENNQKFDMDVDGLQWQDKVTDGFSVTSSSPRIQYESNRNNFMNLFVLSSINFEHCMKLIEVHESKLDCSNIMLLIRRPLISVPSLLNRQILRPNHNYL